MLVCPACERENLDDARFCMGCATPILSACAECGVTLPAAADFCPSCGHAVAVSGGDSPSAPIAERRHLTVMFCDLVDSVALGERLDPEELLEVLQAYRAFSTEIVERYSGRVAQYLGDGLLVYFGYPRAHEDDAERAVRAALEILQRLEELNRSNAEYGREPLALRLGVHSGPVVVGGGGDSANLAVGSTVNLAARLQGAAVPDSAAVSAATVQLVRGALDFQDRGFVELKGFNEPVHLYRPLGLPQEPRKRRLSAGSLLGREGELSQVLDAWKRAKEGKSQVLMVLGEAGIGKSSLASKLREEVEGEANWIELAGSPYHRDSILHPVVGGLERQFELDRHDLAEVSLKRVHDVMEGAGFKSAEALERICELLELGEAPAPAANPELRRRNLIQALVDWLSSSGGGQPTVILAEDLHWFDPTSLELVQAIRESEVARALFLVGTYRPDFDQEWAPLPHETRLTLLPLDLRTARRIVRQQAGDMSLPPEVIDEIATKADGVPLHLEELTRAVVEAQERGGERGGGEMSVPSSLQDSMMERLDRLGSAKMVVQVAAILGRVFQLEHLSEVADLDESAVALALARLIEAELVYPRLDLAGHAYSFRHALLRDAAHESILRSTRSELHRKVAQVLTNRFPEVGERDPGLLATHYEDAQSYEQALVHRMDAGRRAIASSAYLESARHFSQGRDDIRALPASAERDQQELALCTGLGLALIATRGYASDAVHEIYARAEELCDALGDPPEAQAVLYSLWSFHLMRAERENCENLLQRLKIRSGGDQNLHRVATAASAITHFYAGRFPAAIADFEVAIAGYDPSQYYARAARYVDDPLFLAVANYAWCLAIAGQPIEALRHQAVVEALCENEVDSPFALVGALNYGLAIAFELRDPERVTRAAERVVEVAEEQGFPTWGAIGQSVLGWAQVFRGDSTGIKLIRDGLVGYQMTGARNPMGYRYSYLVDALMRAGEFDEALEIADRALNERPERLDHFYDAELHRMRGELLAERGQLDEARHALDTAVGLSAEQGAGWLRLRALTSSIRWGNESEREALAELVATLPDDLDVEDVRDAREALTA